jgi:hypothetical protein
VRSEHPATKLIHYRCVGELFARSVSCKRRGRENGPTETLACCCYGQHQAYHYSNSCKTHHCCWISLLHACKSLYVTPVFLYCWSTVSRSLQAVNTVLAAALQLKATQGLDVMRFTGVSHDYHVPFHGHTKPAKTGLHAGYPATGRRERHAGLSWSLSFVSVLFSRSMAESPYTSADPGGARNLSRQLYCILVLVQSVSLGLQRVCRKV